MLLQRVWAAFKRLDERMGAITLPMSNVLSLNTWAPALLIFSVVGIFVLHWSEVVMLILTVQTSIDAAATKTVQNVLRSHEDIRLGLESGREELFRSAVNVQMEDMHALVEDIKNLALSLTEKDQAIHASLMALLRERGL